MPRFRPLQNSYDVHMCTYDCSDSSGCRTLLLMNFSQLLFTDGGGDAGAIVDLISVSFSRMASELASTLSIPSLTVPSWANILFVITSTAIWNGQTIKK